MQAVALNRIISGDECYCRISSLVKAFIFLVILLGASVGIVIFFLNNNSDAPDSRKELHEDVDKSLDNNIVLSSAPRIEQSENVKNIVNRNNTFTKSSNSAKTPSDSIKSVYDQVLDSFEDGELTLRADNIVELEKKTLETDSVTVKNDIDDAGDNIDNNPHQNNQSPPTQSDSDLTDTAQSQQNNLSEDQDTRGRSKITTFRDNCLVQALV